MHQKTVYLDYNATTPIDPAVREAMLPFLNEHFGNPASVNHSYGWTAKLAVEKARKEIAELIGVSQKDVIWTSGATESNNMAILGVVRPILRRREPCHIITTLVEHKSVLEVFRQLEIEGAEVTYVAPLKNGRVNAKIISEALKPHTKLVSVIMGQNEIGTINPLSEIGELLFSRKIVFHTDGTQTYGKIPINLSKLGVDLFSASSHKIYGPKGSGILAVRHEVFRQKNFELEPLMFGGGQENGVRPGTLNVPAIVGFGAASKIAQTKMASEHERLQKLQQKFVERVLNRFPEAQLNGCMVDRLPNNISLSFKGLNSDLFSLGLVGLAVSTSSACMGGSPSHVLKAIGLSDELTRSTVRISIGRYTTEEDLEFAFIKIQLMLDKNKSLVDTNL